MADGRPTFEIAAERPFGLAISDQFERRSRTNAAGAGSGLIT